MPRGQAPAKPLAKAQHKCLGLPVCDSGQAWQAFIRFGQARLVSRMLKSFRICPNIRGLNNYQYKFWRFLIIINIV